MPHPTTVWLYQSEFPTVKETQQSGRALFEVHHLTSERVRICVSGDIDATNRQAFGHFVERHTRVSHQLVLDLRAVDFFGSQGFTALYYVSVHCARHDVDWMIVTNRAVDRILRICDSEAELPVVDDLGAAVHKLDRCARYHHSVSWAKLGADDSRPIAPTHLRRTALHDRPAASDCNQGTLDVAALVRGETDIHRRELGRLARPAQRGVLAEGTDLRRRHG